MYAYIFQFRDEEQSVVEDFGVSQPDTWVRRTCQQFQSQHQPSPIRPLILLDRPRSISHAVTSHRVQVEPYP